MPPTTHRRPNPLSALLGRPASSFTAAELDALPLGTSFGVPGATAEDSLSFNRTPKGWADMFGTETSEKLRNISFGSLICLAVGEPEVVGVERPDGIDALTQLDAVLPRPTKPLHVIAEEAQRHARVSAAAMEQLGEAMHRIRRICVETGMSLSIVVGADIAEVQILGAKPDPIDATRVPYSDHLHYTDAASTRYIWRPS